MPAHSPLANDYAPSLGHSRGLYGVRTRDPVAVVVHTTGAGPVRRFSDREQRQRYGWETPLDAAVTIYRTMMEAGPHYVLGQDGRIVQVAPEDECAWHVGGKGGGAYRRKNWGTKDTVWWFARWPGLSSPRDLAGGKLWTPYAAPTSLRVAANSLGGSVNANTIGIEVVPPIGHTRGTWSDEAWMALAALVTDICSRHHIRMTRERIITHSDAHPRARSARAAPWDPSPQQWSYDRFGNWAGLPLMCGP